VHEAATVVLLREATGGPECLMLRKTKGQAFGGLWVFPGGRVEDQDGVGLDGARRAAVREAEEETGLLLDVAELLPLSHWEPPTEAPRRYNTWFFVAGLPEGASEVIVDGGEIGDHVWTTPESAMAAHHAGEIDLLPPTWVSLRVLAGHPDVPTALAAVAARPADMFATRMAKDEAGFLVSVWAPDAAYPATPDGPTGPLDTPGPRHRLYMDPAGWRYEQHPGDGGDGDDGDEAVEVQGG
jgi:8-oxo-dGTP pyrophosphatase MutT (NUDIX family)